MSPQGIDGNGYPDARAAILSTAKLKSNGTIFRNIKSHPFFGK